MKTRQELISLVESLASALRSGDDELADHAAIELVDELTPALDSIPDIVDYLRGQANGRAEENDEGAVLLAAADFITDEIKIIDAFGCRERT